MGVGRAARRRVATALVISAAVIVGGTVSTATAKPAGDSATISTPGGAVTVTASTGRFDRAAAVAEPADAPGGLAYPVGFLGLSVDKVKKGQAVTLTVGLPAGVTATSLIACAPGCGPATADVAGSTITYALTDGAPGDADGRRNGEVVTVLAPARSGCALGPGEHVLDEWEDNVGVTVAGAVSDGQDSVHPVEVPSGCTFSSLIVRIEWDGGLEDLDLDVIAPDGTATRGESSSTAAEEVSVGAPVAGTHTVRAFGWLSAATPYRGRASVVVDDGTEPPPIVIPSDPDRPRVVVADLDSAINPYHSMYYAGSALYPDGAPSSVTQEVLDALGVAPENVVRLTRTGNIADDLEADADFWAGVQRGVPYHFVGTNIVAISFAADEDVVLKPDVAKSAHGVGTSNAVLAANPDAVLLFVEQATDLGSERSHDYAFTHPAVDILTTSYGVSIPNTGFPLPEYRAFEHTYEGVVQLGKLHFSSGGNGPGLTPLRAGAGPWWSIGVGGIEEGGTEGDQAVSGNFPDLVSDFTQDLAYCMDCESGTQLASGTSFSTPRAAGVASRVLLEARTALGHVGGIEASTGTPIMADGDGTTVTNWQLRRALEQAAWLPDTAAYDPAGAGGDWLVPGTPINPVAPWLQIAWGDLSADPAKGVVPAALSELGLGATPREKPAEYCDFQTAVIRARKVYWDTLTPLLGPIPSPFGGEVPPGAPDEDPFVYC